MLRLAEGASRRSLLVNRIRIQVATSTPRAAPLCQAAGSDFRSPESPTKGDGSPGAGVDLRTALLKAALLEVPNKGWSIAALASGAGKCGLSPMAHGLIPRGPVELVEYFSRQCDEALSTEMQLRREEMAALELRNRLLLAMQTRLKMVAPHVANWAEALALRALPTNLPHTLQDAQSLATILIDTCGEDAQAPLFPSALDLRAKQMTVAAVYGASELYMLTDR